MNMWELPTSLNVGGKDYEIRTDYRVILDILSSMSDPLFNDQEKALLMVKILYIDSETIPLKEIPEACKKAKDFIDYIVADDSIKEKPKVMDWNKDAGILIPSINKVFGGNDIRSVPYMHWWTFMGLYMEIGDGTFAQVVNIRQKKAKGKKLEKWEKEFYRNNKSIVDLKEKESRNEEERETLRKLFGFNK